MTKPTKDIPQISVIDRANTLVKERGITFEIAVGVARRQLRFEIAHPYQAAFRKMFDIQPFGPNTPPLRQTRMKTR